MEAEWIEMLRSRPGSGLLGDDAAVIGNAVLTVDMLTEGVDFLLAETDPLRIGRKALAVNLSDIAAMGAIPESFLVSMALPKEGSFKLAEKLYAGMEPLVEKYRLVLAGGDTNTWNGGLVVSITVIGRTTPHGVLRRNGGRPGDAILVTGLLGGSILEKQFLFEPKIFEALYLNEHFDIHAAMDISDGLSLDLHRLARESDCGAVLYENKIPIAADAEKLSKQTGRTPLEHALSDGEDFELLLAVPPEDAEKLLVEQPLYEKFGVTLFFLGNLTADRSLRIVSEDGTVKPLEARGFLH